MRGVKDSTVLKKIKPLTLKVINNGDGSFVDSMQPKPIIMFS